MSCQELGCGTLAMTCSLGARTLSDVLYTCYDAGLVDIACEPLPQLRAVDCQCGAASRKTLGRVIPCHCG